MLFLSSLVTWRNGIDLIRGKKVAFDSNGNYINLYVDCVPGISNQRPDASYRSVAHLISGVAERSKTFLCFCMIYMAGKHLVFLTKQSV